MINNIQRSFVLGDHWLYYKIYTGHKTADAVLTKIIKPITEQLINKGIIDKWFFIRYADSKHHVRVRFHCIALNDIGFVINCMFHYMKKYIEQDLVWKLQIDTYHRELERYGANTMGLSEKIFFYDSKMAIDFIDMIEGEEGDELRWLFSLRAIDSLLDNFEYTNDEKCKLLVRLSDGFRREFGDTRNLRMQLGEKFRIERNKIEIFMTIIIEDDHKYKPILNILFEKENAINKIAEQLLNFRNKQILTIELDDLISSYIHMMMNRLFRSQNRKFELVCYDILSRYYKSLIARSQMR